MQTHCFRLGWRTQHLALRVRDACDLGYLVTTVTDACATLSQERHDWSLRLTKGYARQRTTVQVVEEIERLTARTS
jgi:ureidoacrylate peracid hydrolase